MVELRVLLKIEIDLKQTPSELIKILLQKLHN